MSTDNSSNRLAQKIAASQKSLLALLAVDKAAHKSAGANIAPTVPGDLLAAKITDSGEGPVLEAHDPTRTGSPGRLSKDAPWTGKLAGEIAAIRGEQAPDANADTETFDFGKLAAAFDVVNVMGRTEETRALYARACKVSNALDATSKLTNSLQAIAAYKEEEAKRAYAEAAYAADIEAKLASYPEPLRYGAACIIREMQKFAAAVSPEEAEAAVAGANDAEAALAQEPGEPGIDDPIDGPGLEGTPTAEDVVTTVVEAVENGVVPPDPDSVGQALDFLAQQAGIPPEEVEAAAAEVLEQVAGAEGLGGEEGIPVDDTGIEEGAEALGSAAAEDALAGEEPPTA